MDDLFAADDDSKHEHVMCLVNSCHVYKIPPRASAEGHKCALPATRPAFARPAIPELTRNPGTRQPARCARTATPPHRRRGRGPRRSCRR